MSRIKAKPPKEEQADTESSRDQHRWVGEIDSYEKNANTQKFEERGKKIVKRYKDERSPRDQKTPRYNILWSNVQTLLPALYSRKPKPDVERRFRDKDDMGRVASSILERSIAFFVDDEFDSTLRQVVLDRLLPGRGVCWVRYEPHFKDASVVGPEEVTEEGAQITEDAEIEDEGKVNEVVENEEVHWDYVNWQDFGHTYGRTWDEIDSVWRKVYLAKEELKERFPDIYKDIPLDYTPDDVKGQKEKGAVKKATVYEIWCKSEKRVYWIHKDYREGPLDVREDPLGLDGFFPCPRPLYATLAGDDMLPVADYAEYQDQAMELDEITSRIGAITKCVKVAGVYDASAQGVQRLLAEGVENQLLPIEAWAAFSEKGGLKAAIALLPMQEILQTLLGLYEAREKIKQDLYEITGISDIIRGSTDANETALAQQIKSQFGTMRLAAMQDEVQRFARDMVRIGTRIIAEHFSLETLKAASGIKLLTQAEKMMVQAAQQQHGMPLPPQLARLEQDGLAELMEEPTWEEVAQFLKDEPLVVYRIDIETDSTIKFDQDAERQARVEFLTAAGGFLEKALQVPPELAPLAAKMLMFGIRGFKVGKELEGSFESAIRKLERKADSPQGTKPDPEMAKVQGQMQIENQKMQNEVQLRQMQLEADRQKTQIESQSEIARLQAQAQVDTHQATLDAQLEREKSLNASNLQLAITKMDNETKVIVAQISAKAQLDAATLQANSAGYLAALDMKQSANISSQQNDQGGANGDSR